MTAASPNAPAPPAKPSKAHPSGDNRFKMLEATMKRHHYQSDALIEVLHTAQELFGYLEMDLLLYVAHSLKVPPSRVFGVATFYHFFSLKPQGEHTCVVCMGTACYVKGAGDLVAAVERQCGIRSGETTPDGKVSIITARCLGACGIAPAVVLDGQVAGYQTAETLTEIVKGWMS
ncbi:MAG: bidirectional hydrogenase complex protein HoxE [Armatimonadetes bacterium]|nr:bidirectional hydrogenase complex protein HoxE [Armatimonadota bacterium]